MKKLKIISIYLNNEQVSRQKYALFLINWLFSKNLQMDLVCPQPVFSRIYFSLTRIGNWLGYIDRDLVFDSRLNSIKTDIVHICD